MSLDLTPFTVFRLICLAIAIACNIGAGCFVFAARRLNRDSMNKLANAQSNLDKAECNLTEARHNWAKVHELNQKRGR